MERNIDQLRVWCVRKHEHGWPVVKICSHARIPRRTFYFWLGKYEAGGIESLKPKSRRPKTIHSTPPRIMNQVIALRKKYGWGPNKIEGYLKHHGIHVGHNVIYRSLCKEGLNNPLTEPRKTWGTTRFQREHSNSLWQSDFKLTENDYWMISFQDDHSRFIVGSEKNWTAGTEDALHLLERSIHKYGQPKQILTDQGSQFWCVEKRNKKQGITQFTQFCMDAGIEHIVASVRRPTTIGKIEAFHKAYVAEAWRFPTHRKFVNYYNNIRPHQELNYLTPREVYYRDL